MIARDSEHIRSRATTAPGTSLMTAGTPSPRTSTESRRHTGPIASCWSTTNTATRPPASSSTRTAGSCWKDVYNGFDDLLEAGWAVADGE